MPGVSLRVPPALSAAWPLVAVALYGVAQLLLLLYASHRYLVLARWWRSRRARALELPDPPAASLPVVTVQLPVYNERRVVERLVDAVAALDYPRERLEIQVLDDSTDDTSGLAAAAVARHRARGVDIHHLRRPERAGYKAGALAAGLARARGEWIAVFDADFVPPPGFLRRAARHFAAPDLGLVQARWGHLNRDASLLTAAQAVLLDSHFLLEHASRMACGLFLNFNGTAGVWRRACIVDAGGWSHDTLTEDLDLSYRAQLRGWRFAFDPGLVAPAELPGDLGALRSQQRRWAKGSIQTARKLLGRVWSAPLPAAVKLEATLHLTANACYPLLLVLALLLAPVLLAAPRGPVWLAPTLQALVLLFGLLPSWAFLLIGQRAAGRRWRDAARDAGAALLLAAGLCVVNARAVLEGLGRRVGDWERTPKSGEGLPAPSRPRYRSARGAPGVLELGLALALAGVGTLALRVGEPRAFAFAALMATGLGAVGVGSLGARLASRRMD